MANNTNSNIINTNSSLSSVFGTVLGAAIDVTAVTFNAGIEIATVAVNAATASANIVCTAAIDNAPAAGKVLAQTVKVAERMTIGCGKNAVIGTETVAGKAAEMANATADFVAKATPVITSTACKGINSSWTAAKIVGSTFIKEYKNK